MAIRCDIILSIKQFGNKNKRQQVYEKIFQIQ